MSFFELEKYCKRIEESSTIRFSGRISHVVGLVIESVGPAVSIGELCYIDNDHGERVAAEVVGFKENKVLLMPLGEMKGINPGSEVTATGHSLSVPVGPGLLGRIIDGLGNPLDGKGPIQRDVEYACDNAPINPLKRRPIEEPLVTGIKAIDGLLTCGRGQRVGIFAGSGVGKSVLLGMIARSSNADVNVIALIGERGREVLEFIERDLGEEGLKRSVIVVATSDQPALVRIKGAMIASSIAEYFRDCGQDVVLMMDSLTRFAMAQREVGLAVGEPPTSKGYTPSVFALMPRLLERSGSTMKGSITGLYTVLVEGDDMNDPVADSARAILDGHIVLSRELASQNHFPAIDVNQSISRVMTSVTNQQHLQDAQNIKNILATYQKARDLIDIGAYQHGSNPKIDHAVKMIDTVNGFLTQRIEDQCDYDTSLATVQALSSAK
jgi:flagellum-specific ATP synthase